MAKCKCTFEVSKGIMLSAICVTFLFSDSDEQTEKGVGRPKIEMNVDEVEFLRSLQLTWTKISESLVISRRTLYRRLKEEGILEDLQISDICDADLDELLKEIEREHPTAGEVLIRGHLAARNVRVQHSKLRAAIHHIDPANTADSGHTAIARRMYQVAQPNAVWHFDGHHKLIRWYFVTHGGVDGFSRMITFLHCSTNNTASTVLAAFTPAVQKYGLPHRVRSNLGGENVVVWWFMIAQYGG